MVKKYSRLLTEAMQIEKYFLVILILGSIVGALMPIVGIYTPKFVLELLSQQSNFNMQLFNIVFYFIVVLLLYLTNEYLEYLNYAKAIVIRSHFLKKFIAACLTMPYKNTLDSSKLNLVNAAYSAVNSNSEGIEGYYHELLRLLECVISFLILSTILIKLNIGLLFIILVNASIYIYLQLKFNRFIYTEKDTSSYIQRKLRYFDKISSDIAYSHEIRSNHIVSFIINKFNLVLDTYRQHEHAKDKFYIRGLKISETTNFLSSIMMLVYIVYEYIQGAFAMPDLVLYVGALGTYAIWFEKIIKSLIKINRFGMSIDDYFKHLSCSTVKTGGRILKEVSSITFKNVVFSYPHSSKKVLNNISFSVSKGENIAITGKNGVGKSTLIQLLMGFYEVSEGTILINDIPLDAYDKVSLLNQFAPVFQNPYLLAFSVKENIALLDNNPMHLQDILKQIHLYDKIASLKEQEHTLLTKYFSKEGVYFSGGETQKIAFARALYKDADVMILDEPTAALDPISEANFYSQYASLSKGKTSFFITHRLASTRFCDRIFHVEGGKIVEVGSHRALIALNGAYAKLYFAQAEFYKEVKDEH